jgi:hypothetical protein
MQGWFNRGVMTMTYQDTNVATVENIGGVDRVNRMIVALTLVAVVELFAAIPAAAVFSIIVVSLYAGLTAAIGWDPLLPVVKAFSQRVDEQAPATVTSLQRKEEHPASDDYKKAA